MAGCKQFYHLIQKHFVKKSHCSYPEFKQNFDVLMKEKIKNFCTYCNMEESVFNDFYNKYENCIETTKESVFSLNNIMNICLTYSENLNIDIIKSKRRTKEVCCVRMVYSSLAREFTEFSQEEIMGFINKNRTSIYYFVKTCKDYEETDFDFKNYYEICRKTLLSQEKDYSPK
mgnify:CR=1 FL=1